MADEDKVGPTDWAGVDTANLSREELYLRLKTGCSLIKVSASGKPVKRSVYLDDSMRFLKWLPSKKTADELFVDIDKITAVIPGRSGARMERMSDPRNYPDTVDFLNTRDKGPVEHMCGFLEKMGGVRGGRKSLKKRWVVLVSTDLLYYKSAADRQPKGQLNLVGATVTQSEDKVGFKLRWENDQPEREFCADTAGTCERWVFAINKVIGFEQLRRGSIIATPTGRRRSGDAAVDWGPSDMVSDATVKGLQQLGRVDPNQLFFSVICDPPNPKGPVSFMAGSLREFDMWYTGIMEVLSFRKNWDYDQMIENYKRIIAAHPTDHVTKVLLGNARIEVDELGQSEADLLDVVKAEPRLPSARKSLGRLYLGMYKDPAKALPHLEAAAHLMDHDDIDVVMMLAEVHYKLRHPNAAIRAYDAALAIEPRLNEAKVGKADCYLMMEQFDVAATVYEAMLLQCQGDDADLALEESVLRTKLAQCLIAEGKPEEAVVFVQKGLTEKPKDPALSALMADCLRKLGRHRESVLHYETVVQADPHNVAKIVDAANAYYLLEQQRSAATTSRSQPNGTGDNKRNSISPTVAGGKRLSVALPGLIVPAGSLEIDSLSAFEVLNKAEQHLIQALTLRADSPEANILCGKVYERLAELETAQIIERLQMDDPTGPQPVVTGDELASSGWTPRQRLERAEMFYDYVAQAFSDPVYLEAPLRLGIMYKSQYRLDDAIRYFDTVLKHDSCHEESLDFKARCQRLIDGLPEFEVKPKTPVASSARSKAEELEKQGVSFADGDLAGAADTVRSTIHSGMSRSERDSEYFKNQARLRKQQEEDKKAAELAKVSAMTEEERAEYDREQLSKSRHEEKKNRTNMALINAYGQRDSRNNLLGRGRGRGKGGSSKSRTAAGGAGGPPSPEGKSSAISGTTETTFGEWPEEGEDDEATPSDAPSKAKKEKKEKKEKRSKSKSTSAEDGEGEPVVDEEGGKKKKKDKSGKKEKKAKKEKRHAKEDDHGE